MTSLKDKKILLVIPNFHGYETAIADELTTMGLVVNDIVLATVKANDDGYWTGVRHQIAELIVAEKFDFLMAINTNVVTGLLLTMLKKENPQARSILYLWDSLKNWEAGNILSILDQYDYRFSFEYADCINFPALKLKHRPLFFHPYAREIKPPPKHQFDMAFVNSAKPSRIRFINQLERLYKNMSTNFHLHFTTLRSVPAYLLNHKVLVKPKNIKLKKLSIFKTIEILNSASCCLDIPVEHQFGLSIGVFNIIGLNKKMVTTNQDIAKYDFYHPDNILVIPPADMKDIGPFLKKPQTPVAADIIHKYSVAHFVKSMLLNEDITYCVN